MTRLAAPADLDAVHTLLLRWAEAVDETRLERATVEKEWSRPGFDVEHDHWVAERDGAVVGYVALKPGGDVVARGETADLIRFAEERAREVGLERLETILTRADPAGIATLEGAGWEHERDVLRMWLELAEEPPEPAFPAGVDVRPYRPADAPGVYALLELAFAENNERVQPFDEWLHFMTGDDWFDARFWHLAERGGELVGCVLTWAPHPAEGGWVKDLGVHPEHRRRGLGEALLHHAARAYRAAGVRRVGLKVDDDNPTGAPRLYERLGYRTDRRYAILARHP